MTALLVGAFSDAEREDVQRAAARSGIAVALSATPSSALTRLRSGGRQAATCVLAARGFDLRRFIDAVRDEAELFTLPVLASVLQPSSDVFSEAYLAGADDVVVAGDSGGLTRRLAHLSQAQSSQRPAATLGHVVVCAEDAGARRRIGRTLRQAGFDVAFGADLEAVQAAARGGSPPLFGVAVGEPPDGLSHQQFVLGNVARVDGVPVLFMPADEREATAHGGEQLIDATGRLLFFADERAKATFTDRRSSARRLYTSVCAFREAGSYVPSYGVTYNVSREGMYVRTFDPPPPASVLWTELRAPGSGQPLHLRVDVVWQRLPGAVGGTLPPGFGLRIDQRHCPPADVRDYLSGYASLIA
jgi:hypothetical protein